MNDLKFKNFIFDFGQVIVKFDTEYMTAAYINEPDIKAVEEVVFDRLYWDRLDAGTITDDEVREGICGRLPKELQDNACKVYDNWYKNLNFIDGMPELIKDIKAKGGKLYLLSNISETFAKEYKNAPNIAEILSLFDGLVFSAPLGITKPNKEIFDYILNEYNLNPYETVFIDDNEKNASASCKENISGYLFDGDVDKLKSYLKL